MNTHKTLLLLFLFILIAASQSTAQMERERAQVVEPVETFWTPNLITQTTTETLQARNLNVTIMHTFGIATSNVVQNFFGLDNIQNVRIGLDYGITDNWSVGIGRSSLFNVVDIRSKYALMRQNTDGSKPVSIALKGDLGIVTQENRLPLRQDIGTFLSATVSKKFNKNFSLQLAPMYADFNEITPARAKEVFSVGLGSRVKLSDRFSMIAEYYPILYERRGFLTIGNGIDDLKNAFSMGLNIQTGGHVFQLFFTSTRWHLEQYVLTTNREQFWAGDFRFGFNVNRIFGL